MNINVAFFLEIKNEYTEHLIDTLAPYIYEGLTSIYKEAVRIAKEIGRYDNILIIFQKLLQSINEWNQLKITEETNRIKQLSNTADYLDDLIKAVIKSNIILLTCSNSISNLIGQSFYNSFSTPTFIHRCYAECGKDAHNNPYLFYHDVEPMDYKRNQLIIHQNIQSGISRAIRKILPISMILKEYLVNSINIIQEPPKVELVKKGIVEQPEQNGNSNIYGNRMIMTKEPSIYPNILDVKYSSEKKIDPVIEKEVMNIIKSENIKTDKQKIQAIMNIDKILTSMEPQNIIASVHKNKNQIDNVASQRIIHNSPEILTEETHEANNYNDIFENIKPGKSEQKLINLKFEKSQADNIGKNISSTTLSSRPMPSGNKGNLETTEKIDPTKINLIEDYGMQTSGKKSRMRYV
jgi:hypothetical protein